MERREASLVSYGKFVENAVIDELLSAFHGIRPTKRQDWCEGTDFFLNGIRVDITSNLDGKDHVCAITEKMFIPGAGRIRFGVRTGNRHASFDEPVLVMEVTTYGDSMKRAFSLMGESAEAAYAVEAGQDFYWQAVDILEVQAA